MPIPKKLHYVWFGDPNAKPPMFFKCLASWKKFCPDFEIVEWNESNFDVTDSPFSSQAYAARKYAFASDFARIKILREQGGIYLDTDVELTKPLDDLLQNDAFISFENCAHLEGAVMGMSPHHPFCDEVLKFYENLRFDDFQNKASFIANTMIYTHLMRRFFGLKTNDKMQTLHFCDDPSVTVNVYPHDWFSPINYTTKKLRATQNTRAIHYFDASWFSSSKKRGQKALTVMYYVFTPPLFKLGMKITTAVAMKNIARLCKKVSPPPPSIR